MGLRLWGWLRRVGRSLGSVRGILLALFGSLVFVFWVFTLLLGGVPAGQHTAEVRRYGPLALAAYCGRELLLELERSEVAQVLLAPFRWFVNAFTSERLWPDLARWAALGLLVNLCLLAVVFALDAHYLETSAAASERAYTRLQQLRRG